MIKILKNPCNLYTAGWVLYYLQGTLYPYGSVIAKILLVLLIVYSLYFIASNRKLYNIRYFNILFFIVLLYVVYTFILYAFGESFVRSGIEKAKFEALKNIFISIAPLCCYYGFAQKGLLTSKWFTWGVLVLLMSAIASFYWEKSYRLDLLMAAGSSREEITNNTGYLFAAIIPMLVLLESKSWYKYAILLVVFVFSLLAMKRGALLVCFAATLIFIWSTLKSRKGFSKFAVIILSGIAIIFIMNAVSYMMETSDYFNTRLEQTMEGSTSDRDVMFVQMFNYFINSTNVFRFLFGYGIDGTGKVFGFGAHNDWFEFAIDMGLLGLIVYLIYWIRLYTTWRKSRPLGAVSVALGIIIISELLKSFFSFSINDMPIQEAPAFGYCLACVERFKKRIIA